MIQDIKASLVKYFDMNVIFLKEDNLLHFSKLFLISLGVMPIYFLNNLLK